MSKSMLQDTTINLRLVVWPADFRRSEATLLNEVDKRLLKTLKGNDAVCFVSSTGNQVLFVYRRISVGIIKGREGTRKRELVVSTRLRLNRGEFNPAMLANYADQVGLKLAGIKRFEERYAQLAA